MAARGGPPDPTAEEKLPHPIIQSAPRLQKTIRHPGKAHLPRLYWTPPPPCGGTDASKTPTPEPGPSACTNPCSRRHTNQDPSPPGPAVTPTRRQSAPRTPSPPGPTPEQCGRQAGNLRPPAQASPAAPHVVARKTAPKSHQYPIQAKAAAPAPNPPRNPPPGNPQMPQAHNATPRQQQKPQPDRIGTPIHTR